MGKWLYSNNPASPPLEQITVTGALLCCTISLWSPAVRPKWWSASSRLSRLCCYLLCADNNNANISSGGGSLSWRARIWIFLKIVNKWTMFQWKYIDIHSFKRRCHPFTCRAFKDEHDKPGEKVQTEEDQREKGARLLAKVLGFLLFCLFCSISAPTLTPTKRSCHTANGTRSKSRFQLWHSLTLNINCDTVLTISQLWQLWHSLWQELFT